VTRAECGARKPHPDLYSEAAARLGVAPADALAVEDSPAGTQAAIAAGMPVVVVPDLVHPPHDVRPHVAAVFDSLDALRETAARLWVSRRDADRRAGE
jgi:beta-phosphoglucomutase-like phosphatase (HAD superfamily)